MAKTNVEDAEVVTLNWPAVVVIALRCAMWAAIIACMAQCASDGKIW